MWMLPNNIRVGYKQVDHIEIAWSCTKHLVCSCIQWSSVWKSDLILKRYIFFYFPLLICIFLLLFISSLLKIENKYIWNQNFDND